MIEMKVSFDPDGARAREDTRFWAALAHRLALDRIERSAGTGRAHPALYGHGLQSPGVPRPPASDKAISEVKKAAGCPGRMREVRLRMFI
jgi:hypothetical protein